MSLFCRFWQTTIIQKSKIKEYIHEKKKNTKSDEPFVLLVYVCHFRWYLFVNVAYVYFDFPTNMCSLLLIAEM